MNDIAIFKINAPLPPHFKAYYSGWTAVLFSSLSGKFFDIHHPVGDIKKISSTMLGLVTNSPIPTRYNVEWLDGVTEHGSSGSGLFNFNRRLIGTLSFGLPVPDNCIGDIYANFGKFRNFWLMSQATRQALNPDTIV